MVDFITIYKNIRDLFYVIIGIVQSYFLIRRLKPNLVFSRGGYVSVPVCVGAKFNHVNYITHDSDSIASLANRVIAKDAVAHFVSTDKKNYKYPTEKMIVTGIPVSENFKRIDLATKLLYRRKLNYLKNDKIILIIGGGQGARDLNNLFISISSDILKMNSNIKIIHLVGSQNYKDALNKYSYQLDQDNLKRVNVLDYTEEVYLYSGVADLIITRGGATNLAEFAIQAKACIIVPSSFLASNHQLENAKFLSDNNAAILLDDKKINKNKKILFNSIINTLTDGTKLRDLETNISKYAKPNATEEITKQILSFAGKFN